MSNLNQDLVMETTHGRKPKCKTEFKAVLNKVLVSGLVLATILGSTTPAFAATSLSIQDTMDGYKTGNITQEYGINVEREDLSFFIPFLKSQGQLVHETSLV